MVGIFKKELFFFKKVNPTCNLADISDLDVFITNSIKRSHLKHGQRGFATQLSASFPSFWFSCGISESLYKK